MAGVGIEAKRRAVRPQQSIGKGAFEVHDTVGGMGCFEADPLPGEHGLVEVAAVENGAGDVVNDHTGHGEACL
jgi:hypothetical protein